jgi:hypothetical protein
MMTPRSLRLLALAPVLAAVACTTTTVPDGTVGARATIGGIVATNGTTRPIFYTAVERGALALYDYAECSDATRCDYIAAGESGAVPWSRVVAYSPGRSEYVFLWWQAPEPGRETLRGGVVVTR